MLVMLVMLISTYQKLFSGVYPAAANGILTAIPSGKFCIPIPIAKFLIKEKKIMKCLCKNNKDHREFLKVNFHCVLL